MSSSLEKATKLRQRLTEYNVDAFLIPHEDAHESEYIASADERLAFISGFTGSAGYAFVSQKEALMWTDGRYYLQAEKELENPWEMRKNEKGHDNWVAHVKKTYPAGFKVGYDPMLRGYSSTKSVSAELATSSIEFVPVTKNLIDLVWEGKPEEPLAKVKLHDEKWHHAPFSQKFDKIKELVTPYKASFLLTQLLDEIAWTLNLRGNDIDYNPVFKSFLLLSFADATKKGTLYIDSRKLDSDVSAYLAANQIEVKGYADIFEDLKNFKEPIALDEASVNCRLHQSIDPSLLRPVTRPSPITILKALKNPREVQGFRDCSIRDAAALISYFALLHNELVVKGTKDLDEYESAQLLAEKRYKVEHNQGLSFGTISCAGANAAIIHYHPHKGKSAFLSPDLIYLCDSGGQYSDGTTDITRTLHYGKPTAEEKDAYTRVLLGNLDIQRVQWPRSSALAGQHLDVLARRHLWESKMDYAHGTGHGVGYFMNVHEGPQGLNRVSSVVYQVGMTITDEPGYYLRDKFGIRIEDDLIVVDKGDDFLGFENVTTVPYERSLIDLDLISKRDRQWIDKYHADVFAKVGPLLQAQGDTQAYEWLKNATAPL